MTHIGRVLDWRFNSQRWAVHGETITEFPGGIPTQADQDTWTAEYEEYEATTGAALLEISRLETLETKRRIAEAALGIDEGWLAANRALIATERAKL